MGFQGVTVVPYTEKTLAVSRPNLQVCLSCHNKVPQGGWGRGLPNRNVPPSSGGWSSKIKEPAGLGPSRLVEVRLLPTFSHVFTQCTPPPHCDSPSSYKGTSFIGVGPHTYDPAMTSLKAPSPNTVPLRVRASLLNLGETQSSLEHRTSGLALQNHRFSVWGTVVGEWTGGACQGCVDGKNN